jgi:uncharacterized protein YbaR (Trm112 family)
MPVEPVTCPKCKQPASEYAENKWKCLNCGAKFIDEPPVVGEHEQSVVHGGEMSGTFTCKSCGGVFPLLASRMYACGRCGASHCRDCFAVQWNKTSRKGFVCRSCWNTEYKRKIARMVADERRRTNVMIAAAIVLVVLVCLLYIFLKHGAS